VRRLNDAVVGCWSAGAPYLYLSIYIDLCLCFSQPPFDRVVAPPSSVVKCLQGVFVWGFGVLFLSCVCVSGVLFSVGVCVCVCVCVTC